MRTVQVDAGTETQDSNIRGRPHSPATDLCSVCSVCSMCCAQCVQCAVLSVLSVLQVRDRASIVRGWEVAAPQILDWGLWGIAGRVMGGRGRGVKYYYILSCTLYRKYVPKW